MAHFAQIKDNVVIQVIVVGNCDIGGCIGEENVPAELWIAEDHANCGDLEFPDTEVKGQEFIASIGIDGDWLQTSINHRFRKIFASIGGTYDKEKDVYIIPKPHESWSLDEDGDWQAPVPEPDNGELHFWVEEDQRWMDVSHEPPSPTT